jgi:hypothetical protein
LFLFFFQGEHGDLSDFGGSIQAALASYFEGESGGSGNEFGAGGGGGGKLYHFYKHFF